MLYLDESLLIGKGEDRECYQHPEKSNQCIKVTFSGDHKQSNDEISYYRLMKKRGISYDHLIKFFGLTETNLGQGLIFTLIRDFDGQVSKSLGDYLSTGGYSLNSFKNHLDMLFRYLMKHHILVRDLSQHNILFQKTSKKDGKLIIIDGLGNNEFIPLSSYFDFFCDKKIMRKWDRFQAKLIGKYYKDDDTGNFK